jgi:hypothetical protein
MGLLLARRALVRRLVRAGLPPRLRGHLWLRFAGGGDEALPADALLPPHAPLEPPQPQQQQPPPPRPLLLPAAPVEEMTAAAAEAAAAPPSTPTSPRLGAAAPPAACPNCARPFGEGCAPDVGLGSAGTCLALGRLGSAEACRLACLDDDSCSGFTFHNPETRAPGEAGYSASAAVWGGWCYLRQWNAVIVTPFTVTV